MPNATILFFQWAEGAVFRIWIEGAVVQILEDVPSFKYLNNLLLASRTEYQQSLFNMGIHLATQFRPQLVFP